jgi:hypothetical protein
MRGVVTPSTPAPAIDFRKLRRCMVMVEPLANPKSYLKPTFAIRLDTPLPLSS